MLEMQQQPGCSQQEASKAWINEGTLEILPCAVTNEQSSGRMPFSSLCCTSRYTYTVGMSAAVLYLALCHTTCMAKFHPFPSSSPGDNNDRAAITCSAQCTADDRFTHML